MFTGLIEERGSIQSILAIGEGLRFEIAASQVMDDIEVNASVAVNGCCLTVVEHSKHTFFVDVVEETLKKTTLGSLKVGTEVNLERAMRLSDRLGGHLVLGHVDGVGRVLSVSRRSTSWWVTVQIPMDLEKYVIQVGSIAIDGVSLTAAEANRGEVSVSIIPHTWEVTCLSRLNPGDIVNIEVDLIGKYVEKIFGSSGRSGITEEWLKEKGF